MKIEIIQEIDIPCWDVKSDELFLYANTKVEKQVLAKILKEYFCKVQNFDVAAVFRKIESSIKNI